MAVRKKQGVIVYFEKDQKEVLDRVAKICNISGSEVVRQALDAYLKLFRTYLKESGLSNHQKNEAVYPLGIK